jgi:hypothetical protein
MADRVTQTLMQENHKNLYLKAKKLFSIFTIKTGFWIFKICKNIK